MRSITSKVVLLGDQGVGKTSIRRNFMGLSFVDDHTTTLGVDMSVNKYAITDNVNIDFQIWDFAGQIAFRNLHQRSMLGTQAILIVFDLLEQRSLDNTSYWLDLAKQSNHLKEGLIVVFVGNKKDLLIDKVNENKIRDVIAKILDNYEEIDSSDINLILTSAKTGENINQTFEILGNRILASMD